MSSGRRRGPWRNATGGEGMGKVKFGVGISLDGFLAGPNARFEEPLGDAGEKLHEWMFKTAVWQEAHGGEGGATGRDDDVVRESTENTGAYLMGRQDVRRRRGRLGGRVVEGLVGRRSAIPRSGLRADPPSAGVASDGGRHHVPLRHGRPGVRAGAGPSRRGRRGRPDRGRRERRAAVPQRGRGRRVPGPRGAHLPGRRRSAVRRPWQRRDQGPTWSGRSSRRWSPT